ncbi:MAG: TonB-dependent receptor plug domain-containing protein, partial [Candidatus Binatia bacterium]
PWSATAQEAERPRVVEEILVTAQKKEESIQDVPISITAFSGEFLSDAGIDDIHELTQFAPNASFRTNETVFIRGVGSPFGGSSFDPSVGLAIDEMSIAREMYLGDAIYDIERFEVLRGPQGTLFGKNTPAGLFNVTTAQPTREFSGYLLARAGALDYHRIEGALGGPFGPLGDIAQFRFSFVEANLEEDVFNTKLRQGEDDRQQRAARFKLATQPLDGLEILFIGSIATSDAITFHAQAHKFRDSHVEWLRRYDPEFEADGENHQTSADLDQHWKKYIDLVQTNVTYDAGDLGPLRDTQVVAVLGKTGFDFDRPTDTDLTPARILNLDPQVYDYDQQSAELRFSGT